LYSATWQPSNPATLLQRSLKQSKNPLVLIRPTRRLDETVIFDGEHRHAPVFLAQLDQLLREAHRVLEVHVRIDHAVADEQRSFQSVGEVDRRRLSIRLRIILRRVEDVARVWMVVVRPIGDWTQRGGGRVNAGRG